MGRKARHDVGTSASRLNVIPHLFYSMIYVIYCPAFQCYAVTYFQTTGLVTQLRNQNPKTC
jgi:hypothetical protein